MRVVQRLGRRLAVHVRVLVARRRPRVGLLISPSPRPFSRSCKRLAVVGLQRGQDFVELHRRRRLRDRDRVAVADLLATRRAGRQIHEEVALEEDARADLGRRVVVDRQALLVHLHRDLDHVRVVVMRSTFTTLPTFTPAIRTGESSRRSFEVWKTAWNWNGSRHGSDFVNASHVATVMISSAIAPARTGFIRPRCRRGMMRSGWPPEAITPRPPAWRPARRSRCPGCRARCRSPACCARRSRCPPHTRAPARARRCSGTR